MAKLKPCPFCGSTNIDCTNVGRNIDMWYVQCNNCYATFPQFDSKEEATEAWNTRTPKETHEKHTETHDSTPKERGD